MKEKVIRVPKRRLRGFPKGAEAIEKWIVSLGGKPTDKETERRLKASGHWGMPDE